MTQKILIINGHPIKKSFCEAIVKEYKKGAKTTKAKVDTINIIDLKFNPNFKGKGQKLEADIKKTQKKIKDAEHIVIVYPTWWGSMPALLTGFFERVLTPGFAYQWNGIFHDKLLKGKSARVIVTMGAPKLYYEFTQINRAGHRIIKHAILNWVGIKPVRFSVFGSVPYVSENKRKRWLKHVYKMGVKQK